MAASGSSITSSPVKRTGGSSMKHGVLSSASRNRQDDEEEVIDTWIGPMPVAEFMEEYMACQNLEPIQDASEVFSSLWQNGRSSENVLVENFVNIINISDRFPGFKLVNTGRRHDKNSESKLKPDACVYTVDYDESGNRTDFRNLDMFLEFKPSDGQDLFNDLGASYVDFCTSDATKVDRRGQIIGYAAETSAKQHRTHVFSASITGKFARLFRWDRSGTAVTERFDYRERPALLLDFFRRYSRMSRTARGYDPTVRFATPAEEAIALTALAEEGYEDRIDPKYPTTVLEIYDQAENENKYFYVGRPEVEPSSLVGRATKAYIAVDAKTLAVVFVKDCWRVTSPGMEKEGDTLRKLNQAGVRHIPTLLCAGDVGGDDAQSTKSYCLIDQPWRIGDQKLTPHSHYRQAVDVVGKTVHEITSSRQLVRVIHDAFIAHSDAFVLCRILHRDVSAGNILIGRDGGGLLNDWDMSKDIDSRDARQHDRTGTWLYMSARLLKNPMKPHEIQDDMESFVHVLIYIALVYTPLHIIGEETVGDLIGDIFHEATKHQNGRYVGGKAKSDGFTYRVVPLQVVFHCQPVQRLVEELVFYCRDWLQYCDDAQNSTRAASALPDDKIPTRRNQRAPLKLDDIEFKDHKSMTNLLASIVALPDDRWPEEEKIEEKALGLKHKQQGLKTSTAKSSSKRGLESMGDSEVPKKSKRLKSTPLSSSHT
ncbi:hypothetical protein BJ138DRAFT_1093898 [Hygrophoropsis aurantiaca]|uniref:Uncharacterized protein n=1 Tax=Hygrophoropsis aurantiaca TaxID=72124 RepID=A0ACB7ZZY8_9AGAM|nr:hypothetical protein BJ138DRAFT_1093898 [Hygrophoropsis aurantiaca]